MLEMIQELVIKQIYLQLSMTTTAGCYRSLNFVRQPVYEVEYSNR